MSLKYFISEKSSAKHKVDMVSKKVYYLLNTVFANSPDDHHSVHPRLFLLRGMGGEPPTRFSKKMEGLLWPQILRGGLLRKRRWPFFRGVAKLKYGIFNDKKSLLAKIFFSVITKNSNWKVLTKNLVIFKR